MLSSQYCCPARASLLMGVHDSHSHSYTQTAGALVITAERKAGPMSNWKRKRHGQYASRPPGRSVPPELLKKAGYVTGQFGKLEWGFTTWHGE
ncbi:MAG: hypothetical protein ACLSUW_04550 [Akkermansia sp.]